MKNINSIKDCVPLLNIPEDKKTELLTHLDNDDLNLFLITLFSSTESPNEYQKILNNDSSKL